MLIIISFIRILLSFLSVYLNNENLVSYYRRSESTIKYEISFLCWNPCHLRPMSFFLFLGFTPSFQYGMFSSFICERMYWNKQLWPLACWKMNLTLLEQNLKIMPVRLLIILRPFRGVLSSLFCNFGLFDCV